MTKRAHKIFAYGSNMNLLDLKRWLGLHDFGCPPFISVAPARLVDYELVWNYWSPARSGGAANIQKKKNSQVLGAILEVDAQLLHAIDQKEGHPTRYSRFPAPRECFQLETGVATHAWIYEVTPEFRSPKPTLPTQAYMNLLIEGAQTLNLPSSYIEQLLKIPIAATSEET